LKLLFVGDLIGNTGPANVNKAIKKYLPENTLYLENKNNIGRVLELIVKIQKVDVVLFSGMSKINIIGFRLARFFSRKSAYLMHGSRDIESRLNQNYNLKYVNIENKVLELAPRIICVSEHFMRLIKEKYPQYKDKITYVNNGIQWEDYKSSRTRTVNRDENTLMAVGGGTPLKNIKSVCKAINLLNKAHGMNLILIVVGSKGKDINEILSYPFVEYHQQVSHDRMNEYFQRAQLFVQNSYFETFGLAPIEALLNGCDLLMSKETGSGAIIKELEKDDIIYNPFDITEISSKIKFILSNSNNEKLISSINREGTSVEYSVNRILDILKR
jgi:glycosyltransferase involved in cell wall biosynthesis